MHFSCYAHSIAVLIVVQCTWTSSDSDNLLIYHWQKGAPVQRDDNSFCSCEIWIINTASIWAGEEEDEWRSMLIAAKSQCHVPPPALGLLVMIALAEGLIEKKWRFFWFNSFRPSPDGFLPLIWSCSEDSGWTCQWLNCGDRRHTRFIDWNAFMWRASQHTRHLIRGLMSHFLRFINTQFTDYKCCGVHVTNPGYKRGNQQQKKNKVYEDSLFGSQMFWFIREKHGKPTKSRVSFQVIK